LRNGYIVPYQDALTKDVKKTQDLLAIPTDLYILPVTTPVDMTLSTTTNAVARGDLYFDDGISVINDEKANPFARFEFFMTKSDDGKTFTITVKNVGKLTKPTTPNKDQRLGNINVLWASKSGVSGIKTVTLYTADGKTQDVKFTIGATSETLTIPISTDDTTFTLLWDITKIVLSQ
jgi:hypothetical protein